MGEDILVFSVLQPKIEGGRHGSAHIQGRRFLVCLALWPLVLHDLHDAIAVRNVPINGKLVCHPDANDEDDRHTGGEPEDIDKGVATVPAQLTDGKEEIVFEHALGLRIRQDHSQKSALFLDINNQPVAIYLILLIVRFRTFYVQFLLWGYPACVDEM